jgi:hypothetical protein
MPSNTDIIQRNIQKQISLNSGQLSIVNLNGSYQWVDTSTGKPISGSNDVGNYALSQAPAIYQSSMRAEVYNYAKGLFGGKEVPPELVEVLATMATYYSVQTGQPVTKLFNRGVLLDQFMATINNLRNRTSQLGYAGLNLSPSWANNVVLRASIARAIEPWDAIGVVAQLQKYNDKPVGFTFYASDTNTVYVRITPVTVYPEGTQRDPRLGNTWEVYEPDEPIWPA